MGLSGNGFRLTILIFEEGIEVRIFKRDSKEKGPSIPWGSRALFFGRSPKRLPQWRWRESNSRP